MRKQEITVLYPSAELQWKNGGFIAKDGKIDPGFERKIAELGADIAQGGLLMTAAVFENKNKANVDRAKISKAINNMLKENRLLEEGQYGDTLLQTVKKVGPGWEEQMKLKEQVLLCALALKHTLKLMELAERRKDRT